MTASTSNLAARLESTISAPHVTADFRACEKYSIDNLIPSAVVHPASAEEVAEIVRFAIFEKLAVVPCGARSKLGIGMPPARYHIALDMSGLRQIAHYDPGDLTLSVDAGMPLAELSQILARKNQFLPLAVPFFEESTVGGTIASGVESSLQRAYGSARDFLIGAEFVNGSGTLTKSGGRVVKNVSGYDLHKLLIGSLGTLAAITRLNFRTFPSPPGYGHAVTTFSSFEAAINFRSLIVKSPIKPSSLEILDPAMAQRISSVKKSSAATSSSAAWFVKGRWHVSVSFEGNDAVLRRYERDLTRWASESRAASSRFLDPSEDELLGWSLREMLQLLEFATPGATIFKLSLLSALDADTRRFRAIADQCSIPSALLYRDAGALYFVLLPETDEVGDLTQLARAARAIFDFASSKRGHASIITCPTSLKRNVNVWGLPRSDSVLMGRVKQAFDPQNIFAPGRFVAGI
ncbi:MAG TPA: FAD-binding oxidoreductase [Candidatus Dormibacteraeota bacterium]|nr:FAD-binding oxidoreductase [Candidatus Dormibacteraeota bacterium]